LISLVNETQTKTFIGVPVTPYSAKQLAAITSAIDRAIKAFGYSETFYEEPQFHVSILELEGIYESLPLHGMSLEGVLELGSFDQICLKIGEKVDKLSLM